MNSASQYDVVVVGAGPAGSAASYFLSKGGLKVALLDKFDFPRDKTCGDGLTPRAVKVLEIMGVLPQIEPHAYHCSGITLRYSDSITYRLELSHLENLPRQILILPRLSLDDILRQHAVASGAVFMPRSHVAGLEQTDDGRVRVDIDGSQALECSLVILAVGASTRLLRQVGLLKQAQPANLAARAYFEGVEGLDDTTTLFFDSIPLPGYGWVFPVAPGKANIGCGVFFDSGVSQSSQLRQMIESHPYLKRILKHARQIGPIKGYPLRTDFSPQHSGSGRILVVGEAVGLVNPITGEGIDYALESAQLAARVIQAGWQAGTDPGAIQRQYRSGLSRKFRYQLAVNHLTQRIYFREGMLDKLLKRAHHKPYLRQAIVDACFGSANPAVVLSPRTLWDVFGP